MPKQVLFIQGAGEGAHEADAEIVEGLQRELGSGYTVVFPVMPNEADVQYEEWRQSIERQLAVLQEPAILVAHSVGASILLKCLNEMGIEKRVASIFLMAAPFWGGDGWLYDGYEKLELPNDLGPILPSNSPVFLYHCRDDDIVPYEHMALYAKLLPYAAERRMVAGGHQFNNNLGLVASDIKNMEIHNHNSAEIMAKRP